MSCTTNMTKRKRIFLIGTRVAAGSADKIHRIALALASLALLATVHGVAAQSVSVTNSRIEILDTDGDSAVLVDSGADYAAGGNGRTATLNLRGSDGPATLNYQAFQAQLVLGGGTHEGILLIKDDDGVTTTIEVDGRTGVIRLGGNGEDGDLLIHDSADAETFRVNGQTGTATNELSANGQVKAWARINADGTVLSCWRCNPDATSQLGQLYTVDFSPLGADIQSRPRMVVMDSHAATVESPSVARLQNGPTPTSVVVWVTQFDAMAADPSFTLLIY